jgi:hypothetical protein
MTSAGTGGGKGKANMATKWASMAKTVGGPWCALDGSRVGELGEGFMPGVAEPLMPKRGRRSCKESGGRG